MRVIRTVVAALLVLGALLATAGSASAHGITYSRGVHGSFKPSGGPPFTSVAGDVTSSSRLCRAHVTVFLWQSQPGADAKIGSTRTNSLSKWHIARPSGFPSGTYYVTVPKRVLVKNQHHHHVCPGLKTSTFAF